MFHALVKFIFRTFHFRQRSVFFVFPPYTIRSAKLILVISAFFQSNRFDAAKQKQHFLIHFTKGRLIRKNASGDLISKTPPHTRWHSDRLPRWWITRQRQFPLHLKPLRDFLNNRYNLCYQWKIDRCKCTGKANLLAWVTRYAKLISFRQC